MDRCVVRQAIKETMTGNIIGYELLFQGSNDSFYDEPETSAADMISNFLMNNSNKFVSDKIMFITFTPSLLFRNTPKMFEPDKVVIQIEDNLIIHPLARPFIKKYCELGYRFAINDFQFSQKYMEMLEYAQYIRINLSQAESTESARGKKSIENIVSMAQGTGKKCIATGVNTKEVYDYAVKLKVDYLEGNYVAKTLASKVDKVKYMQGNFFQLMVAVSEDEPDMEEIERIVSRDAGLTYAILKLVNSAYFALRRRTASIRQALVTLGITQLRQWVYMLSFDYKGKDSSSEELLKISFLRATFASELVGYIKECPISKTDAYLIGMFSTLEYMVNATEEEILEEIPVNPEVKKALVSQEGTAGMIYRLLLAYEQADWKLSKKLSESLGVPTYLLAQTYIDCVDEVNEIWQGLTTEYDRPGEERRFMNFDDSDDREHLEDVLY
ncbi:diguanylate cyclase [Lachnospiraceae bacterium]|uniref:EAL and HDOD domain-containing protein n=1 Tax=Extibacter sp. GGCC_0201 TaxID=2731209 RepID=UPI001AA0B511|nr:HDOD domain-containing protein [Extibacter sp. GGCC_0201]MBO1719905.1 HDOD domain-containing protein [Extibacter sp. GGCC_0201]BDF35670.1 diguanylate cyclase [Lachnospiraceae bacterium]BDF39672.1 diguanylate cyclase [Lachnospiraceae bacterium]